MPKKKDWSKKAYETSERYRKLYSVGSFDPTGNPYANESSDMESLDRLRRDKEKSISSKVDLALKIRRMKESGEFSAQEIEEVRKDAGLSTRNQNTIPLQQNMFSNPTVRMLENEIAQEDDPDVRIALIQTLAQVQTAMSVTGGAPITISPITRRKKNTEESSTRDKVFDKMLEGMVAKMNEKPEKYDKVADFKTMLDALKDYNEMLTPGDTSDQILSDIKKYKEAGFIKSDSVSIEEKKLDLEKDRITHEYDFKKLQLETDGKKFEPVIEGVKDFAISLAEAAFDPNRGKGQKVESRQNDSQFARQNLDKASSSVEMFDAPCAKCGEIIEVTNVNQSRNITCAGCGQPYFLDGKRHELLIVEDSKSETKTETATKPAPEPEKDTSSGSGLPAFS